MDPSASRAMMLGMTVIHRRPSTPSGVRAGVLPALATARLRAELLAVPDHDRPGILAARQIAPDHVRALGVALGLRLTNPDIIELRARAENAVRSAGLDLSDPVDEVLASAGRVMRAAAADDLAGRCCEARAKTTANARCAGEDRLRASDWRTLVIERWRLLPIMRPREVTDLVAARRGVGTPRNRPLASAA